MLQGAGASLGSPRRRDVLAFSTSRPRGFATHFPCLYVCPPGSSVLAPSVGPRPGTEIPRGVSRLISQFALVCLPPAPALSPRVGRGASPAPRCTAGAPTGLGAQSPQPSRVGSGLWARPWPRPPSLPPPQPLPAGLTHFQAFPPYYALPRTLSSPGCVPCPVLLLVWVPAAPAHPAVPGPVPREGSPQRRSRDQAGPPEAPWPTTPGSATRITIRGQAHRGGDPGALSGDGAGCPAWTRPPHVLETTLGGRARAGFTAFPGSAVGAGLSQRGRVREARGGVALGRPRGRGPEGKMPVPRASQVRDDGREHLLKGTTPSVMRTGAGRRGLLAAGQGLRVRRPRRLSRPCTAGGSTQGRQAVPAPEPSPSPSSSTMDAQTGAQRA